MTVSSSSPLLSSPAASSSTSSAPCPSCATPHLQLVCSNPAPCRPAVHRPVPALSLSLSPRQLCETRNGDLAHAVGRLAFRPGRPMLVEHTGGIFLEHKLTGEVLTPGADPGYTIVHAYDPA